MSCYTCIRVMNILAGYVSILYQLLRLCDIDYSVKLIMYYWTTTQWGGHKRGLLLCNAKYGWNRRGSSQDSRDSNWVPLKCKSRDLPFCCFSLTQFRIARFEKLIVAQGVKKFPSFMESGRQVTLSTRTLYWSQYWDRRIHFTSSWPIPLMSILIL